VALTACLDAHRGQIDALLLAASPYEAGALDYAATSAEHPSVAGFATPESAWTLADDLGMLSSAAELVAPYVGPLIAAVLVPLGLLESVVGLGVRGALQRTAGEAAKGRAFHEHVLHALPELRAMLAQQVRDLYGKLAERVGARFDGLWATELAEAKEVLEQATSVRARGEGEAARIRSAVAEARAALDRVSTDLDAYRADLERLL
jgi:hypothetical protein